MRVASFAGQDCHANSSPDEIRGYLTPDTAPGLQPGYEENCKVSNTPAAIASGQPSSSQRHMRGA